MIEKGKKVTLCFTLNDESGHTWDEATRDEPFTYEHGSGQLMSFVEQALEGKAKGDSVQVEIPPDQAYGEVDENLKKTVSRDVFKDIPNLKEGMQFNLSEDAHISFTVVKLDESNVWVDANHPLAGKTLTFDIEILAVEQSPDPEPEA